MSQSSIPSPINASAEVEAFVTAAVNAATIAAAIGLDNTSTIIASPSIVVASGPPVHGLLSAAYHDHAGPIYVRVVQSNDGTAMVHFENTRGTPVAIRVEMDKLEMGTRVEADFNNGRVEEKRYRFFLIMIDDV